MNASTPFAGLEVGYDIPALPGMTEAEIQTPCLVLDLDALERNVKKMGDYAKAHGMRHRVHGKMHKSVDVYRLQESLGGACGVCCQKVSEAEVFARAGVKDVLVSNQVRGAARIDRLARLPKLGARTIRGSGTHRKNIHKKGGVPAFREMLTVLKEGYCVAMTADVPKVSRVAGQGIVRLAAHSGCPILPVAVASSRRWQLDTWDKSVINLPFSRIAAAAGPLIRVERDADDEQIERLRKCVEDGMNAITARAYALADGKT